MSVINTLLSPITKDNKMNIDDQINALTQRINALETEIAVIKIRTDNHETQMEKLEASIAVLSNIRTDIQALQLQMVKDKTTINTTVKVALWGIGTLFTSAMAIANYWTVIKGFLQL